MNMDFSIKPVFLYANLNHKVTKTESNTKHSL